MSESGAGAGALSRGGASRRTFAVGLLGVAGLFAAGCGDGDEADRVRVPVAGPGSGTGSGTVTYNLGPDQERVRAAKVEAIAAKVPAAVRERGVLVVGGNGNGAPPLRFLATDNKTVIGIETDLAVVVGDVLGLRVELAVAEWAQMLIGLDGAKYDLVVSNMAITEERKLKYDFVSYRVAQLAFEARKGSGLRINGPADVAGRTIAVITGTNQEDIMADWNRRNAAGGLPPATVKNFPSGPDCVLALEAGRVDAYFSTHPVSLYHVAVGGRTEVAGTLPASGTPGVPSLVGMASVRGNGLAGPVAEAVNELIRGGVYGQVLARWGLSSEAVATAEVNPPGAPIRTK